MKFDLGCLVLCVDGAGKRIHRKVSWCALVMAALRSSIDGNRSHSWSLMRTNSSFNSLGVSGRSTSVSIHISSRGYTCNEANMNVSCRLWPLNSKCDCIQRVHISTRSKYDGSESVDVAFEQGLNKLIRASSTVSILPHGFYLLLKVKVPPGPLNC
jgi:hypothetical protein